MADEAKESVARVFDRAAATYDQTGVEFFGPVGRHLVDLTEPRPGERVLDLGCGLGASALPAAERVGPDGHVLGLDLAPRMVEGMLARARGAGLGNVAGRVGDAAAPDVDQGAWDVVQASLVLFFLSDCASAVRRHRDLLRPGGRLGCSWFGREDSRWDAIYSALVAELPAEEHGPKRPGEGGPFSGVEAMNAFLTEAGYVDVRTELKEVVVRYVDDRSWWDTLWSHGRRLTLERLQEAGVLESTMRRMTRELDAVRLPDGSLEWRAEMAFTVARL